MWVNGMIAADNRGQTAVRDVIEGYDGDIEEFGVECDPPLAEEQIHTVHVPETLSSLTHIQQQQLLEIIDTSPNRSISNGVEQYINSCNH